MATTQLADDWDDPTTEIPRRSLAQMMAMLGGHPQEPQRRREDFFTELELTQVLPAVELESE